MFKGIAEYLKEYAKKDSEKIAYFFISENGVDKISYRELNCKVRAIAAQLQKNNAVGQRAMLFLPPGFDYIAAFLGCLYAGVIAVPAYPPRNNRHNQRLLAIIADAEAKYILTNKAISAKFNFAENVIHVDDIQNTQNNVYQSPSITASTLAFLQYTSGSTGSPKGVMVSHENLLLNIEYLGEKSEVGNDDKFCSWLPPYHDMGLVAGILFPLRYGIPCYLMSPQYFLQKPMRWLQTISDYHISLSPAPDFAYALCAENVTELELQQLDLSSWRVAYNGAEPVRHATIQQFVEKFSPCGFNKAAMYPTYGMAETTLICTGPRACSKSPMLAINRRFFPDQSSRTPMYAALRFSKINDFWRSLEDSEQALNIPYCLSLDKNALALNKVVETNDPRNTSIAISCGTAIHQHTVYIVDPETMHRCDVNHIGEIWVQGACVTLGYWRKPEQSAQAFAAYIKEGGDGPFYRSGDLGFLDSQGNLFITGRLTDVLIIRGRNIYPQDIEETTSQSHADLISHACAAFMREEMDNEQLVIVQEVHRHAKDCNAIFAKILQNLLMLDNVIPSEIVLIRQATLPKTSSGKIQRRQTRQELKAERLPIVAKWQALATDINAWRDMDFLFPQQPPQQAETITQGILQAIATLVGLDVAAIDCHLAFSQLGFNSIQMVMLTSKISFWLNRELSPVLLFEQPTIAKLSDYLARELGFIPKIKMPACEPLLSEKDACEKIAIIGMGCRFPGHASNPTLFWELLSSGRDGVSEVPPQRWQASAHDISNPRGGFIDSIDSFDAAFFQISPLEAQVMDPQQRLLLEVVWQALENAGIAPEQLQGSHTGVYVGASNHDYLTLLQKQADSIKFNAYAGVGNALSAIAGRLSYTLGLMGPSEVIDTACSSALVAVHHACSALQTDDCDLAIAGGVNVILDPDLSVLLSKAGMLSPSGYCHTFDALADGYVRAEGCGVVILKRLVDAQRDGDTILAVIAGSAMNQDGSSNGLTAPNAEAQAALYRKTLRRAACCPQDIDYIETHGTGTVLGDPIEIRSLTQVYGESRSEDQTLILGAVKSNIGHLEPAAGIAGLIKVVLALQQQMIPRNLHFSKLNPHINLSAIPAKIAVDNEVWSKSARKRKAAISAFGFVGTNAHMIVEEAPLYLDKNFLNLSQQILVLSAKNEQALAETLANYQVYLEQVCLQQSPEAIANIAYTAGIGRNHFRHRLAIVGQDAQTILTNIKQKNYYQGVSPLQSPEIPFDMMDSTFNLDALARCYSLGAKIDWHAYYAPVKSFRKKVVLPNYPFQRERYWFAENSDRQLTSLSNCCYQLRWQIASSLLVSRKQLSDPLAQTREWIVWASNDGDNQISVILAHLAAAGLRLITVNNAQQFTVAFDKMMAANPNTLAGVIFAAALNSQAPATLADIHQGHELYTLNLLWVSQYLAQALCEKSCLVILTRHALAARPEDPINVSLSPLVGISKVITLEMPQLRPVLLDWDGEDAAGFSAAISQELQIDSHDYENLIAYRQGKRMVQRLQSAQLPDNTYIPDQQATYLITGGLGGLGLVAAQTLLAQGAQHLVLVSRDIHKTSSQAGVKQLKQQYPNAYIIVEACDVSNLVAVEALLAKINENKIYPLKGIIHAAGLDFNALLKDHQPEDFARVFAAKVEGAWNLHQVSQHLSLDFFLFYSSISAVFGGSSQAAYTAANCFLDGLCHFRNTQGLKTQTIQWGPWLETGMAVGLVKDASLASSLITKVQGAKVLIALLNSDVVDLAIISPQYLRFRLNFIAEPKAGIYRYLEEHLNATFCYEIPANSRLASTHSASIHQTLSVSWYEKLMTTHSASQCKDLLMTELRSILMQVLEIRNHDEVNDELGFFEMGMDSLMALEFKNILQQRLGDKITLGNTIIFDFPCLEKLAEHLQTQLNIYLPPCISEASEGRPEPITIKQHAASWLPLSGTQIKYWLEKNIKANISVRLLLRGDLNVEMLRQALTHVVRHQPMLWRSFNKKYPLQRQNPVHDYFDMPVVMQATTQQERTADYEIISSTPLVDFGLPLIKIKMYCLGVQEYEMQWVVPHIVADHESMTIFKNLFNECYALLMAKQALPSIIQPYTYEESVNLHNKNSLAPLNYHDYWHDLLSTKRNEIKIKILSENKNTLGKTYLLEPEKSAQVKNMGAQYNVPTEAILLTLMSLTMTRLFNKKSITLGFLNHSRDDKNSLLMSSFERGVLIKVDVEDMPITDFIARINQLRSHGIKNTTLVSLPVDLFRYIFNQVGFEKIITLSATLLSWIVTKTKVAKYYDHKFISLLLANSIKTISGRVNRFLKKYLFLNRKTDLLLYLNYYNQNKNENLFNCECSLYNFPDFHWGTNIDWLGFMLTIQNVDKLEINLVGRHFDDDFRERYLQIFNEIITRLIHTPDIHIGKLLAD